MQNSDLYLAFLIDVDRNSVTFALHTIYAGKTSGQFECRIASLLDPGKVPGVLEEMDLAAIVIQDWRQLYKWLGRVADGKRSWAAFT